MHISGLCEHVYGGRELPFTFFQNNYILMNGQNKLNSDKKNKKLNNEIIILNETILKTNRI